MFEFAVGLLLINIWPDTLRLVAFYGLVGSVGNVLGGAPVGEWVDRGDRLMVVRRALMVANGTVIFSREDSNGGGVALRQSLRARHRR